MLSIRCILHVRKCAYQLFVIDSSLFRRLKSIYFFRRLRILLHCLNCFIIKLFIYNVWLHQLKILYLFFVFFGRRMTHLTFHFLFEKVFIHSRWDQIIYFRSFRIFGFWYPLSFNFCQLQILIYFIYCFLILIIPASIWLIRLIGFKFFNYSWRCLLLINCVLWIVRKHAASFRLRTYYTLSSFFWISFLFLLGKYRWLGLGYSFCLHIIISPRSSIRRYYWRRTLFFIKNGTSASFAQWSIFNLDVRNYWILTLDFRPKKNAYKT